MRRDKERVVRVMRQDSCHPYMSCGMQVLRAASQLVPDYSLFPARAAGKALPLTCHSALDAPLQDVIGSPSVPAAHKAAATGQQQWLLKLPVTVTASTSAAAHKTTLLKT